MTLDPMEVLSLAVEAEQLAEFIARAVKVDATGRKRMDAGEVRELIHRAGSLIAHASRDIID